MSRNYKPSIQDYQEAFDRLSTIDLEENTSIYDINDYKNLEASGDFNKVKAVIFEIKQYRDLEQKLGIDLITFFGLVGKEVYIPCKNVKEIEVNVIMSTVINKHGIVIKTTWYDLDVEDFNKTFFLTKEEAKKHLEGRK